MELNQELCNLSDARRERIKLVQACETVMLLLPDEANKALEELIKTANNTKKLIEELDKLIAIEREKLPTSSNWSDFKLISAWHVNSSGYYRNKLLQHAAQTNAPITATYRRGTQWNVLEEAHKDTREEVLARL